MRDFRFVIPIKLEDLTQSSGEFDVYFVQIEYTSREVVHKLNGIYFDLFELFDQLFHQSFD
jgi:hypothetical protein